MEHVAESKDYFVSSCGSLLIEEMAEFFDEVGMKLQKRLLIARGIKRPQLSFDRW